MSLFAHKVRFHHLAKCGGTTFKNWLYTFFDESQDSPFINREMQAYIPDSPNAPASVLRRGEYLKAFRTFKRDIIAGHYYETHLSRPGTFHFTILRKAKPRLLSQVSYFKLLAQNGSIGPERSAEMLHMDFADLLNKYGKVEDRYRMVFNNHMVRAMAVPFVGTYRARTEHAKDLLPAALESMEKTYAFVGLTENLQECTMGLARALGLPPPPPEGERLNTSESGKLGGKAEEHSELVEELSMYDAILYEKASALFYERYRKASADYSEAEFEANAAPRRVDRMTWAEEGDFTTFNVKNAMLAIGIHGRDAIHTPSCRAWSGPTSRLVLYMPALPGVPVDVGLWIYGYADESLRDNLKVEVNDKPVKHYFEPSEGYRERLMVRATPKGNFIKLAVDVKETTTKRKFVILNDDTRLRGISFDKFGWRNTKRRTSKSEPPSATSESD